MEHYEKTEMLREIAEQIKEIIGSTTDKDKMYDRLYKLADGLEEDADDIEIENDDMED